MSAEPSGFREKMIGYVPQVVRVDGAARDNTGRRRYAEGAAYPSPAFPSDHALVSAVFRLRPDAGRPPPAPTHPRWCRPPAAPVISPRPSNLYLRRPAYMRPWPESLQSQSLPNLSRRRGLRGARARRLDGRAGALK